MRETLTWWVSTLTAQKKYLGAFKTPRPRPASTCSHHSPRKEGISLPCTHPLMRCVLCQEMPEPDCHLCSALLTDPYNHKAASPIPHPCTMSLCYILSRVMISPTWEGDSANFWMSPACSFLIVPGGRKLSFPIGHVLA